MNEKKHAGGLFLLFIFLFGLGLGIGLSLNSNSTKKKESKTEEKTEKKDEEEPKEERSRIISFENFGDNSMDYYSCVKDNCNKIMSVKNLFNYVGSAGDVDYLVLDFLDGTVEIKYVDYSSGEPEVHDWYTTKVICPKDTGGYVDCEPGINLTDIVDDMMFFYVNDTEFDKEGYYYVKLGDDFKNRVRVDDKLNTNVYDSKNKVFYYITSFSDRALYKYDLKTNKKELLLSGLDDYDKVFWIQDKLLYLDRYEKIDDSSKLYQVDVAKKTKKLLLELKNDCYSDYNQPDPAWVDEDILYVVNDNMVYTYDVDTQKTKEFFDTKKVDKFDNMYKFNNIYYVYSYSNPSIYYWINDELLTELPTCKVNIDGTVEEFKINHKFCNYDN